MNKILFIYKRQFNENITLIANNTRDLKDYLIDNYNFDDVVVGSVYISIKDYYSDEYEVVIFEWVKHI